MNGLIEECQGSYCACLNEELILAQRVEISRLNSLLDRKEDALQKTLNAHRDSMVARERLAVALEWYSSRAADVKRYLEHKPPMTEAIMSLMTELSLDGGQRGVLR